MLTKIRFRLELLALGTLLLPTNVFAQARDEICLLEPFGSVKCLKPDPELGLFFTYFNLLYPWLAGVAAGMAVLMTLFGGLQVMFYSGDASARSQGLDRIKWSIAGLILLGCSGIVLRLINPAFYK